MQQYSLDWEGSFVIKQQKTNKTLALLLKHGELSLIHRIHGKVADLVVHAHDPNVGKVEMVGLLEFIGQSFGPSTPSQ